MTRNRLIAPLLTICALAGVFVAVAMAQGDGSGYCKHHFCPPTTTTTTTTTSLWKVTGLHVTSFTDTSVSLDWDSDPSGTRLNYWLYTYDASGMQLKKENEASSLGTSSSLTCGTDYIFKASAQFSSGEGPLSDPVSQTTAACVSPPPPPPPPPPTAGTPGSTYIRPTCTIYASPTGGGDGSTVSTPTTFSGAYSLATAGSTICLEAGVYDRSSEFDVNKSGSAASGYLTFRSLDPANPAILRATASMGNVVQTFASYGQYMDIVIDGNGALASNGIHLNYTSTHQDHNRIIDSTVLSTGAGGIVTAPGTDYFEAVGNKIWRFGDVGGWSSGISFHNGNGAYWADTAPGFHNVIVGNFITGGIDNSSFDSDGNGIIQDLGGNVPPTLIADNVVYMNGGRCIHALQQSGISYAINNSCYKNGLDGRKDTWDEFRTNQVTGQHWVNNLAVATRNTHTYAATPLNDLFVSNDFGFGGSGVSGVPGITVADPLYVNPPSATAGDWQNPPRPETLGDAFKLQAGSPAVDTCDDPRALPGLDSVMLEQINRFVMIGVDGVIRPQGAGFDCGAYER